jgi:hypothetical protein
VKNRRLAIAGIALAASLSLATAGCSGSGGSDGSSGTTSSPTPAIAADPKQALADSVKGLAEGNFTFTLADHESTGSGSVHAPSKSTHMEMKSKPGAEIEMSMGFVSIDQERWLKVDLGPEFAQMLKLPDKWMHLDPAKITDSRLLKEVSVDFGDPEKVDPAGAAIIFKALVAAERAGEGKYSGTVDLTRATDAGVVDEEIVEALADKAKAIPFTANIDAQGRITQLTLDVPATGDVPAHKLEVGYSDYGAAAAAKEPPAGQTQEAPASAYELLNG